jgi:hypothetical protein
MMAGVHRGPAELEDGSVGRERPPVQGRSAMPREEVGAAKPEAVFYNCSSFQQIEGFRREKECGAPARPPAAGGGGSEIEGAVVGRTSGCC